MQNNCETTTQGGGAKRRPLGAPPKAAPVVSQLFCMDFWWICFCFFLNHKPHLALTPPFRVADSIFLQLLSYAKVWPLRACRDSDSAHTVEVSHFAQSNDNLQTSLKDKETQPYIL